MSSKEISRFLVFREGNELLKADRSECVTLLLRFISSDVALELVLTKGGRILKLECRRGSDYPREVALIGPGEALGLVIGTPSPSLTEDGKVYFEKLLEGIRSG